MQDPLIGTVLDGRYEILARIGEGGMGVVYKARQVSIDRVIAIKVLNPQMAQDPTWVQRFGNEARACSRLQHPNTIRMFDFGQTSDGRYFLTMEFLEGNVLRQAIQQGPMAPHRVVKVLIQCCASLAEAHSIGIIHRDIKPDNVFLLNMAGSPDFVKLLDFSVAKLLQENDRMKTQAGVVFGTPQYMSPEQGRGLPLDARSDLYALGILAFEMLTGRVPFNDDNPMTVLQMHLRAELPPLPPNIPPNVAMVVRRALEKDPSRRYQSAGEMMQHCQQVFAELNSGQSVGAGGVPKTMIAPAPGLPGGPPLPAGMAPPPMGHGGPPPPMGVPPGMGAPPAMGPPGMGAPPGYPPPQASAAQKTMIAGMAAAIPGHPGMQGGPPPPMGGPPPAMGAPPPMGGPPPGGGYQAAGHAAKTMMAMAPVSIPGHPGVQGGAPPPMGGPPPPMGAGGPPPGFPPPMGAGGPPPGYPAGNMAPGLGMPPGGTPPHGGPQPQKTMMLQDTEGIVSVAQRGPIAPAAQPSGGASTTFWILSLLIGVATGALAYIIVLQV
ncbi:MAG TPA: serine/threonine-protein kinase [Kofleriaceae bacterium]|nr:serine/threonine-protein kinase [Kofleriaceae bacterium]